MSLHTCRSSKDIFRSDGKSDRAMGWRGSPGRGGRTEISELKCFLIIWSAFLSILKGKGGHLHGHLGEASSRMRQEAGSNKLWSEHSLISEELNWGRGRMKLQLPPPSPPNFTSFLSQRSCSYEFPRQDNKLRKDKWEFGREVVRRGAKLENRLQLNEIVWAKIHPQMREPGSIVLLKPAAANLASSWLKTRVY